MNSVLRDSCNIKAQLKDSQAKLKQLKVDQEKKEVTLKLMQRDLEDLKCTPSIEVNVDAAWDDIKNKERMLEDVTTERNALKAQLCRMIGMSEVLRQLKERADMADQMEEEICRLSRELKRLGHGAAGDVRSAAGNCERCRCLESQLEAELAKNVETEAERNLLRERSRASDVAEAELLAYKVRFIS